MPTFSWTVSTANATRISNGFASHLNYDANKLPNETKGEFAQRMVREYIKKTVARAEASEAGLAAARAAESAAMSEIEIT